MASISIRGVLSWENSTTISPAFFIAWWDLFLCRCSPSLFLYYYQSDNKALIYVYLQFSGKMREVQRFLSRICAHKVRDIFIAGKAALLSNYCCNSLKATILCYRSLFQTIQRVECNMWPSWKTYTNALLEEEVNWKKPLVTRVFCKLLWLVKIAIYSSWVYQIQKEMFLFVFFRMELTLY